MPHVPTRAAGVAPAPALTDVLTSAANYAAAEKSANTRRAYRSDWDHFTTWCASLQLGTIPAAPASIAGYLAHLADSGLTASTIGRRVSAIAYAHKLKGCDPPTSSEAVKAVLRGIRRRIGVSVDHKAPATAPAIGAMLEHLPDTLTGVRDRALLLVGFAAALRRSELVDLNVNDLELHQSGLLIRIRSSKTDQEGAGATIPVPNGRKLRPVAAVHAWLEQAQITSGPVFRSIDRHGNISKTGLSDKSVADIVKRYAKLANMDPALFAGHSLRAGFVTSALEDGADLLKVMDITRHRRVETLKIYDRRAQAFRKHAGEGFL